MTLLDLLLSTHQTWQHIWPLRGKYAVRHVVAVAAHLGLLRPIWFTVPDGFVMYLDPQDYIQRRILCEQIWEVAETRYVRSVLRQGQVFIDVGANVGYFTFLAAKIVGDNGRVLSVEPNPSAAAQLKKNLDRNRLHNVILEQVACLDSEQAGMLYPGYRFHSGASSLVPRKDNSTESVTVDCATLDRLVGKHRFQQVNFVKIDVEGAELSVLRGMTSILERFRPALLIELEPRLLGGFGVHAQDIIDFLRSKGYSLRKFENSKNCVFLPNSVGERGEL